MKIAVALLGAASIAATLVQGTSERRGLDITSWEKTSDPAVIAQAQAQWKRQMSMVQSMEKRSKKSKDREAPHVKESKSKAAQTTGNFTIDDPSLEKKYINYHGKGYEMVSRDQPGRTYDAAITWYSGSALGEPYCGGGGVNSWTPSDFHFIAAVTERWQARPKCGTFLWLSAPNGHSAVVRVVDLCADCPPEVPHVDLTRVGFSMLYDLDIGYVEGIKVVELPDAHWVEAMTPVFGPNFNNNIQ